MGPIKLKLYYLVNMFWKHLSFDNTPWRHSRCQQVNRVPNPRFVMACGKNCKSLKWDKWFPWNLALVTQTDVIWSSTVGRRPKRAATWPLLTRRRSRWLAGWGATSRWRRQWWVSGAVQQQQQPPRHSVSRCPVSHRPLRSATPASSATRALWNLARAQMITVRPLPTFPRTAASSAKTTTSVWHLLPKFKCKF